jgi:hypothetical protein
VPSAGKTWVRIDDAICDSLMIAFLRVMAPEFRDRCPERFLAKQDHPVQARFFDRAHGPFRVCVKFGARGGNFTDFTLTTATSKNRKGSSGINIGLPIIATCGAGP